MIFWPALPALVSLGVTLVADAAPTVAGMRWHRRVLVISAPVHDPKAAEQRRILDGWHRQAADRDISVVEVTGAHVTGASDDAAVLRNHYRLDAERFAVLLIGKDGNVALRSARPVAAERLQATIDAMPMRRAGEN